MACWQQSLLCLRHVSRLPLRCKECTHTRCWEQLRAKYGHQLTVRADAHSRSQSTQDSAPHCAPTSIAIDGVSGLPQAMNVSQRSLASNKAAMQQRLCSTRSLHSVARRALVTPRKGSCIAAAASKGCKLVGVGSAAPATVLSNDDLSKLVDTNDEWIAARTGIRRRHVLAKGESLTQLAAKASQQAMEMAGVQPEQIDMVLFACSSPDDLFGGACQVGCRSARTDPCKRAPVMHHPALVQRSSWSVPRACTEQARCCGCRVRGGRTRRLTGSSDGPCTGASTDRRKECSSL